MLGKISMDMHRKPFGLLPPLLPSSFNFMTPAQQVGLTQPGKMS